MQDWLSARAAATPDEIAMIVQDKYYSYHSVNGWVYFFGGHFRSIGIKAGTRVAVLISTNIDFAAVVQTLAAMRVILVPLNIRLTPTEIKWHIEFSKCDVLLYSEELKSLASLIDTHIPMHNVDEMVTVDYLVSLDGKLPHGYIAVRVGRKSPDLSATQAIVFTSGTSGKPKGVEITFGNHFYSAMASAYRLGLNPNDRWLSVLPLYHVGGLAVIFRSTLYGITTVLHDRFDIDRIQYSFDYHGITMISLVPTMLYRMIEAGVRWPDSLRLILLGGAAAPPELLQRAFDMGLPIAPTYGLTEAASQVATMRPEDAWKKPGSVGKPLMFTSVRIADENGGSVPAGEYGEVLVGGPTVMKGYYKNDDANAKTLFNGELRTGDIGYLDEDGDLWLVQRRSDLIVSGGENVYPAEVENVLRGHPAVREAVVVGVNHPEWGQQVAAAIQLADGATLTEQELTDYSREHLAGYKQPRRILFVEAFPQTASGKIQRGEVSKLFDDTN